MVLVAAIRGPEEYSRCQKAWRHGITRKIQLIAFCRTTNHVNYYGK
jgi:hypothetical protein